EWKILVGATLVLLVPLIPPLLSLRTFDQLTEFVAGLPGRTPTVLAFLSMVDRRKKAHRNLVDGLPQEREFVVPEAIPYLSVVEQMALHRAPVAAFAPHSPAAGAYEDLW